MVQVGTRLALTSVPGTDQIAAYCLTAMTFLALAPTLQAGIHVRVTLLSQNFSRGAQRILEVWAFGTGLLLSLYLTFACLDLVLTSITTNAVSHGMVRIVLWVPQLSMPIGAAALAVAFTDGLICAVRNKPNPNLRPT